MLYASRTPIPASAEMSQSIVICNAFPDDNKGGSAITQQTIAWGKRYYPGAPIFLVPVEQKGGYEERQHRFTMRRHPDVSILRSPIQAGDGRLATARAVLRSLYRLFGPPGPEPFYRALADAAVVVSKGGYVFVERETIGGLLSLWFTALPLVYAARRGAPTVVLCASVGPFRGAASRHLCRWILRRVDLVVARDPDSAREARALGCRVVECPDIAFTLDPTRTSGAEIEPEGGSRGAYAAIVVSKERKRSHDSFLERLRSLTHRLLEDGSVDLVKVVVQSEEDVPLSERFVDLCGDPRVSLLDGDPGPEELMAIYGSARIVIAKRLHAGLFALLEGAPLLLFSTDGVKADGIMEQLGLMDRLLPYPDFSVEDAHERARIILRDRRRETERVQERLDGARREAHRVLGDVAAILQERGSRSIRGSGSPALPA